MGVPKRITEKRIRITRLMVLPTACKETCKAARAPQGRRHYQGEAPFRDTPPCKVQSSPARHGYDQVGKVLGSARIVQVARELEWHDYHAIAQSSTE
eukprot:5456556-Pleurochrysis_carterae.AAC.2